MQSSDSPAESPPKTGAKGPPKKGGKAGKGPPLPGTAGELYAVPDAAASAVPGEASTEILATRGVLDYVFFCSTGCLFMLVRTRVSTTECFSWVAAGATQVSPPSSEAKAVPKPKGPSVEGCGMIPTRRSCIARVSRFRFL